MMIFWKTITFLWPFLKEMILGDKTLKEAFKHHVWRVLLIGVILISFALNFFTIPKLVALSYDYLELKRKNDALIKQMHPSADVPSDEIDTTAVHSISTASAPAAPAASEPREQQYRETMEFFDRLRTKEQKQ